MTLGGVICLLSIADKREKDMNLDMFRLFFRETFAGVVLGTTNWRKVDENETRFQIREQQLTESFWKTSTASGSKSLRFDETDSSAGALLDAILDNVLQTRNELDRIFLKATASLSQVLSKQREGSWKRKDRMIKTDDNVMVGGLPTDIVIPYDSISIDFFISSLINFSVMGPTGVGKSTVRSS